MPCRIMLLDGMSLAHRAFFAIPTLTTAAGMPVNAALGFLNTFYKLYEEEAPDYTAVAFDLPAPTFRHKMFTAYKGTREAMPSDLKSQIPIIKDLIHAMGVPVFELAGYEADDILGTLSRLCEGLGFDVTLVSGDRDLLQTVTDKVCLKIPRTRGGKTETDVFYAADVTERIGVTPKQFIDVKALWGDTSDNIPGVPSIGEKTAVKIIKEFGSVEAAIENADGVTPKKAAENLAKYREQAFLSKELATIDTGVPVDFSLESLGKPNIFNEKVYEEIKKLEFKSLYGKFKKPHEARRPAVTLESDDEITKFAGEISGADEAAYIFLYENGQFSGIFAAVGDEERFIKAAFADLDEERLVRLFAPFFEGSVKKIAWDAKTDMHILNRCNISLKNLAFDAMLAGQILGGGGERPAGAAELWASYAAMRKNIAAYDMENLYYNIELPLVPVLFEMEARGVSVDMDELKKYGALLGKRIDELILEIYNLTGEEFNLNSPKQLGVVLFEKLGLPEGKKTKTGYSTAADVLERLAPYHPAIGKILEYRQLSKLKSTYADGLLAAIDKSEGKIHSHFTQAMTATGRLSSTEPNLQNIPVRTALGRELRKAFIPSKGGFIFTDADYSQIELRVLAHMSGDETFIRAFRDGLDIHNITASEVFGTPLEEVTKDQRRAAKAVNFGIIYGQSAFGLAGELGITTSEAERYINGYFNRYTKIKTFMDKTVEDAKKNGYTTTIKGRRRLVPELSSPNRNTRAFGERAAMNMPIQGSAADIIKIAMIRVSNRFRDEGLKSRLVLQVHDELLIETHTDEINTVHNILKEEMEHAVSLSVPLTIDVNTGNNWFESH